jgi:hypothetical protein
MKKKHDWGDIGLTIFGAYVIFILCLFLLMGTLYAGWALWMDLTGGGC